MWFRPQPASEPESWYSYFQSWLFFLRQILTNIRYLGYGGLNVKRYWIWKRRQADAKGQILTDQRGYYWCGTLAVSQEARRKGIGRKLVEIVTNQADREGMKCYLESSKLVPNVDIYHQMGFEMAIELDCEDGGDVCKVRSTFSSPFGSLRRCAAFPYPLKLQWYFPG
jgi:GNAT superfamily N-acetyltransferase